MTSVAETCRFKIDLRSRFVEALCSLAVSIPHHETNDSAASNGRLVLARAKVSVQFRPGGRGGRRRQQRCDRRLRTTRLTRSRSATLPHRSRAIWMIPFSTTTSDDAIYAAAAAGDDAVDAAAADGDDAVNTRDCFLLGHCLAKSGLLSVVASDQIDRLRGEARAKTTGFRSALHQLDGVTNVLSLSRSMLITPYGRLRRRSELAMTCSRERMTGLYRTSMPVGRMTRSILMMVAITADREKSVASQRPSSRLRRRVLRVHQPRRCTKNDAVHSSKKNMLTMKPLSILVINLPSLDRQLCTQTPFP